MKHGTIALLTTTALLLSACGDTKRERLTSGALIGAGTGAVVGAFAGAPVIGAVVGTGVGLAVGGVTNRSQLDWGEPLWAEEEKLTTYPPTTSSSY